MDAFLAWPGFAPATVRSYRQTLEGLNAWFDGAGTPSAEQIRAALEARWGRAAPATWNRHVAAIASFLAFGQRRGLLPAIDIELERRRVPEDRARAITKHELERIWALNVHAREKALWLMLYETAARASEVLSLNIEDLDLANRCAPIAGKGGDRDWIYWQTPTARLLPRLIDGRPTGPLFVTDRAARLELASDDICPHTGRPGCPTDVPPNSSSSSRATRSISYATLR